MTRVAERCTATGAIGGGSSSSQPETLCVYVCVIRSLCNGRWQSVGRLQSVAPKSNPGSNSRACAHCKHEADDALAVMQRPCVCGLLACQTLEPLPLVTPSTAARSCGSLPSPHSAQSCLRTCVVHQTKRRPSTREWRDCWEKELCRWVAGRSREYAQQSSQSESDR